MLTLSGFRSLSSSYALLVQRSIFCPSHLPFGDACIFPPSLPYDPLPPQNLASHNLVSRRQSVVVLTVKMVYVLRSSAIIWKHTSAIVCDRDRRRPQKIEPCSIFCDRLRSFAILQSYGNQSSAMCDRNASHNIFNSDR